MLPQIKSSHHKKNYIQPRNNKHTLYVSTNGTTTTCSDSDVHLHSSLKTCSLKRVSTCGLVDNTIFFQSTFARHTVQNENNLKWKSLAHHYYVVTFKRIALQESMRIFIYHSFVCAKETEKRFAVGSTPHHNEIIVTIREDTRKDDATAYNLYIDDSNSLVSRIQSSWTQNKVAYLLLAHTKIAWIPYTTHPICISNTGECVYVASIARNKCHKSLWSMLVFRVVYVGKSGKIKMQELVGLFAAAIVRLQRKACANIANNCMRVAVASKGVGGTNGTRTKDVWGKCVEAIKAAGRKCPQEGQSESLPSLSF